MASALETMDRRPIGHRLSQLKDIAGAATAV